PQSENDEERPRRLREAAKRARAAGEETAHTRGTEGQNEAPDGSGGEESEPQDEERADFRGAVRVDELGHQRKEKQGHFGVEHVGEHALAERRPRIDRVCDVRRPESRGARDQHANAEVDEVDRASDLQDKKRGGRGREDSRQSERRSQSVNDTSGAYAQSRGEADPPALSDAAAENVQGILTGREVQQYAGYDEQ